MFLKDLATAIFCIVLVCDQGKFALTHFWQGMEELPGMKGERGLNGPRGQPGEKEEKGYGAYGGPVRMPGNPDPPELPGRPGLLGPPGIEGARVLNGPRGQPGEKEEKGYGAYGGPVRMPGNPEPPELPGRPGHLGPPGIKGALALNSPPGHPGEQERTEEKGYGAYGGVVGMPENPEPPGLPSRSGLLRPPVANEAQTSTSPVTEKDLRRHLFKDYDKLVRPVKNPKTAVSVSVTITPIVLREVDVDGHSMTVDSWLNVVWKDEYLIWDPEEFNGIERFNLPISEVWSPDLSVYTGNSDSHHLPTVTTNVVISSDGELTWIPPFSIHNRCPKFEQGADKLECTISVLSWTYDWSQLDLKIHSKTNESLSDFEDTHPNWKLEDMFVSWEVLKFNCCPEPYPTVHFTFNLKKREQDT